jgi:hypothetical protein
MPRHSGFSDVKTASRVQKSRITLLFSLITRKYSVETGSHMTAHTTIQSSRTGHFLDNALSHAFCGDLRPFISGILVSKRLQAPRRRFSAPGLWVPNFRSRRLGLEDAVFVQVRPLFRIETERLGPQAPFRWRIAEPLDAPRSALASPIQNRNGQVVFAWQAKEDKDARLGKEENVGRRAVPRG